ncbi:amino acid adenylation domain-containing protein [Actinophytocola sp.]|uniref:amino acid adenylation domain-containing protein n=1 Tax=Actinophytocola sp. TaxID=1872138 RepID=UPI003899E981
MEYPLSAVQAACWFDIECGHDVGAVSQAVELTGPFDVALFRDCWVALVARHEVLRTTFDARDGVPFQVVLPARELDLREHEVAGTEVRDVLERDAAAPFDVRADPLLRLRVYREHAQRHRERHRERHWVLVVLHPLVADLPSAAALLAECAELYRTGRALPPPPARYRDFVAWQADFLTGPDAADQLAGLAARFTPAPAPLELPRGAAGDGAAFATRTMPAATAEALAALARDTSTTSAVALTTLFQIVLHRYTGQDRIVVGTVLDGRPEPRFARVAGNFANRVPVDLDLGGDPTFAEVLARGGRAAGVAHAARLVPFSRLVGRVTDRGDSDRSPVCQAVHVHRPAAADLTFGGGLAARPLPAPSAGAAAELVLLTEETPAGLSLSLWWGADVPAAGTAAAVLENLEELAAAVAADPARPLAKFPLTTARERRLLAAWNETTHDHDHEPWVPAKFLAVAAERPGAVALRFAGRSVTYGELARRVNGLAHHLRDRGVGPGAIVGVAVERSPELVVALLATLAAGAAYLPLDPDYPGERIRFMVEDARPSLVFTQSHLRARLPAVDVPVAVLDELAAELVASDDPVPTRVEGDTHAYVIYTSGSTGRPKGVQITHRALRNRIAWTQATFSLTPRDRVLQKTPSSFDVSVWEFFWPLTVGARLVLAAPGGHRDVAYLVEVVRAEAVTTLHFVPSVLRLFLAEPGTARCPSLRRVLCSGEALPPDAVDAFYARMSCELHNLYGPTEATVDVTWWPCRAGETSTPIGRPVHNTSIHVLDRAGREVPIGAAGEIHIGGVQVATGYLDRPVLTAARFVPDPFAADPAARLYRTGDLGRVRHDGAVEYLGRLDHQVKIYGNRVETGEVETRLAAHPAVADAVVTVAARDGAVRLDAHVVPAAGATPEPAELLAHLHETLPGYMVPSRIRFLDALPLTPSGKADRTALAAADDEPAGHTGPGRPRTPAERTVTRAAARLLGLPEVRVGDNLFALGGDSMTALRFAAALAGQGLDLTVADVVRARTFAQLAAAAPPVAAPFSPPTGDAGRTSVVLRLAGDLDDRALHAALAALETRHAPLRTALAPPPGAPAAHTLAVHVRPGAGAFDLTLDAVTDRWGMALLAAELVAAYPRRSPGPLPAPARGGVPGPPAVADGLRARARETGLTGGTVALAAHARVAGLLAGRGEVAVTLRVDGRPANAAGDGLIGDHRRFASVRVDVLRGTWRDLVRAVAHASRVPVAAPVGVVFDHVDTDIVDVVRHAAPGQGVELVGWQIPGPRTTSFDDTAAVPVLDGEATACLGRVLAAMAADPDAPADTDLRTDEERRLVERVNATARAWPGPVGAHHAVSEHARAAPDAVAVRCGGQELTYGELDARATAIAARLHDTGLAPGSVVAVAVAPSTDLPATLLAVHRAAGAYLPAVPGERPDAAVLVTDRPDLAPAGVPVLDLAAVPRAAPPAPPGPTAPDAPALVWPDGVTLTHRALDNARRGLCARLGWQGEDEVLLATTPDQGWLDLFLPLSTGGRLDLPTAEEAHDPDALAGLLAGATTALAPGGWWRSLVDHGWPGDPALRIVRTGAGTDRLPPGLGRVVWRVHGYPATTFWSTAARVEAPGAPDVGTPLANTTCHVVGEDGRPVPVGVPGELVIGGQGVATAGPPPVRLPHVAPDRLYRTGLRVVRGPDGTLAAHAGCE